MFEMMALAGGFWFFLFVMFVLAAGIFSSEMDSFFAGSITFLLTLGGLQLFGYPILGSVIANPLLVLVLIAIYIAAGSAYAIFYRYPRFLKSNFEDIQHMYKNFLNNQNMLENEESFERFIESKEYRYYRPGQNKDAISSWVLLWPWALLWDLLHRPVIWVYNNAYTGIGLALEKTGKAVTRKIVRR